MKHNEWLSSKPEFTEDCILIAATYNDHPQNTYWDYTLYEIKKSEGYNDKDEPCWYWGIFCDGDEWGDIDDLWANKWFTMPLLKNKGRQKN